jgi:hypothetical protein
MTNLKPNWFLTHTPAKGSQRPYTPLRFEDSLSEGSAVPTKPKTLTSVQNEFKREQRRLERASR